MSSPEAATAPPPEVSTLMAALSGARLRVFDLSRPYFAGMPQSPNHPEYRHALVRRHGDMVRADGSSAANDLIVMGTHVGTHIDAPAHVSDGGRLYGDHDAGKAQIGGRFSVLGIDTVAPIFGRGLLLDIPAALGVEACEPGYEVTPDDLEAALQVIGAQPRPDDVLVVRTGWGQRWDDREAYIGHASGVPGVSEVGAHWLAAYQPRALGSDSIAFEWLAPGAGHALLPAHRVLLVENGIPLIETMALEELAGAGIREFLFVASPLRLVGATGSPVRPLAVVTE